MIRKQSSNLFFVTTLSLIFFCIFVVLIDDAEAKNKTAKESVAYKWVYDQISTVYKGGTATKKYYYD